MENSNNPITTVDPDQGQIFSVVGDTYRLVMTGEQTGGAYAVIDMLVPPKGGPGPHSHAEIEESFYVIDGEVVVKTEAGSYVATKGSFVNIPLGGVVHSFKNMSNAVAHILCRVAPAGLEQMFMEIGKPVAADTFLPPPAMNPEVMRRMTSIAEKYGQKLYPPDYLG